MARPSKLDDVLLLPDGKTPPGKVPRVRWEVIVDRIRAGIPPESAALSTGIDASTYYRWMAWGEDRWEGGQRRRARAGYREFREAVTRARAEAEGVFVAHIAAAAPKDWRAAAFFLERSHPERWRRRDTVYQAGPADGDPEIPTSRVVHDVDVGAAAKLAELVDLVERAHRGPSSPPDAEGGDGGAS